LLTTNTSQQIAVNESIGVNRLSTDRRKVTRLFGSDQSSPEITVPSTVNKQDCPGIVDCQLSIEMPFFAGLIEYEHNQ
jgi:hypothetical protein